MSHYVNIPLERLMDHKDFHKTVEKTGERGLGFWALEMADMRDIVEEECEDDAQVDAWADIIGHYLVQLWYAKDLGSGTIGQLTLMDLRILAWTHPNYKEEQS